MKFWRLITQNADGTPLLGFRYAGPIGIVIALGYWLWAVWPE